MKDLNSLYRPNKWGDVKGQQKTIEILQKQVISKTGLSNAYIFSGKSGIGKTTIARLFFASLNCEHLLANGNPCTKCPACVNSKFQLREINASDSRGIDDMRELINDTCFVPTVGIYTGVLLDEVHMLSKPAWNCLLKPIEESNTTVWMLCTTELHKIPKTIQTRCQVYKLNPLKWTDIHNRLKNIIDDTKISISDEELWTIARNSDNNLRQATHLLEQYSVLGNLEKILDKEINIDFLNALVGKNNKAIWKIFSEWEDKHSDIDAFINALKYDLSICIKLKLELSVADVNPYRLTKYKEVVGNISEDKLTSTLSLLLEIQEKTGGVWDYQSLFMNCLLKMRKS